MIEKHKMLHTDAIWKELVVPRWSRSWHKQETNSIKHSISLKWNDLHKINKNVPSEKSCGALAGIINIKIRFILKIHN